MRERYLLDNFLVALDVEIGFKDLDCLEPASIILDEIENKSRIFIVVLISVSGWLHICQVSNSGLTQFPLQTRYRFYI